MRSGSEISERKIRAHFPAALIATLITLSAFAAPLASADERATPAPTLAPNLSPIEQYKIELDLYFSKIQEREFEMRTLNRNFKVAIEKARREYVMAIRSAKGPTDKSLFSAKFDEAKSNATAELEKAREELGPMPLPPTEPQKGAKSKMSRDNPKNKSR